MSNNKKTEYIIRSYKGPRKLFNYFWKLTKRLKLDTSDAKQMKLRKEYHRFLVHVYLGTKIREKRNKIKDKRLMVPVSSKLIRKKISRNLNIKKLKQCKLIIFKKHFHGVQGGKSREFRLSAKIFDKAIQLETDSLITNWDNLITKSKTPSMVDLFTGKNKYTRKRTEVSLYSNTIKIHKTPDLIKNSIKNSLEPFPFNPHLIIPWLEKLRSKADRSRENFEKAKKEYKKAEKEHKKANGLFIATVSSLTAILNQGIKQTKYNTTDNKEIWEYKTAYSIQEFGRVSEIHGGFQILSKVGKKLLMENVPNLYNYDLKNSQAFILLQEFKATGISCKWLEDYLASPDSKKKYAKQVGISVGCWKDCFYATVMGAVVKGRGAPYHSICNEVKNKKRGKKLHKKFVKIILPLYKASEKWRDYILTSKDKRYTYKHNEYHWKNACRMKFLKNFAVHSDDSVDIIKAKTGEILDGRKIPSVKRRLAAFFLQGREACYIHNLTVLCKGMGIPVYKNEHDGLITGKEIPPELQKKAARLAGMKGSKLEIKDICSDDKERSVNEFINSK